MGKDAVEFDFDEQECPFLGGNITVHRRGCGLNHERECCQHFTPPMVPCDCPLIVSGGTVTVRALFGEKEADHAHV